MKRAIVVTAVLFCAVFGLHAQDASLEAEFSLSATPHDVRGPVFWTKTVTAGGTIDLEDSQIEVEYYDFKSRSTKIKNLYGYISEQPALRFDYGEYGMFPEIYLWVDSEVDTILLVKTSYDSWFYYDDFMDEYSPTMYEYNGLNPVMPLDSSDKYTYYVWVGTYDYGQTVDVDLFIGADMPPFVDNR